MSGIASAAGGEGRPRVLVLSQYYRPEPNFITADVAEALSQHAAVTVVTGHPNYPAGHFYPGTRFWVPSKTVENGVTVWRLPLFPSHSRSMVGRMASYLSFTLVAALMAPFLCPRPHVIWVYHTPFTTALAALWFKLVWRTRVVFTAVDLWPESFVAAQVARPGLLVSLARRYRAAINKVADRIICLTHGMVRAYAAEGVAESRLVQLPVWGEGTRAAPAEDPDPSSRRIVYAGNLGPSQGLEPLVDAAARAEREGLGLEVHVYGDGTAEAPLRDMASRLGATNVTFHGRVAPGEAFEASARALAQVVMLRPSPLFRMTVPSKIFACIGAATPILAGLEGEAAEVLAESGGAIPFDPADPSSLVAAFRRVLSMTPGERQEIRRRLRRHYADRFERSSVLRRYQEIILGPSCRALPVARDGADVRGARDGADVRGAREIAEASR